MRSLATLIKNHLLDLGIKVNVTVRQKLQEIHILLESTYFGDQNNLLAEITKCFDDLDDYLELAKVYAFLFGQPLPIWSEQIKLNHHKLGNITHEEKETLAEKEALGSSRNLVAAEVSNGTTICDRFIICGLGSLGQYSVFNLKKFAYGEYEVKICAIDKAQPEIVELDHFSELLDEPIILGDCRRSEVLINASIHNCRAILLVTSNENVNIEAAITARRLNPNVHIVVRSSRQNLNQLLKEQLGSFVALDPVDLPAASFAVAGLGKGTLGLFQLGERKFRVVESIVKPDDYHLVRAPAYLLHKKQSRLLSIAELHPDRLFFQWQPNQFVQVGDKVAIIEYVEHNFASNFLEKVNSYSELDSSHFTTIQKIHQSVKRLIHPSLLISICKSKWKKLFTWIQAKRSRSLVLWGMITATILSRNA